MYEHLYRCIKQDILQKKLRAGEKLPSKRTFAKNLGVSTITVESAYAQLVAEGFLYTLPKQGYYVCDLEREEPAPIPPPRTRGLRSGACQADLLGGFCGQLRGPGYVPLLRLGEAPAGRDSGRGRGHPAHRHLRRGHPPAPPGHFRPPLPIPGHDHRPRADRGGRGNGGIYTASSSSSWAAGGATRWRTRGISAWVKSMRKTMWRSTISPWTSTGSFRNSWRRAGRRFSTSPPPTTSLRGSSCR